MPFRFLLSLLSFSLLVSCKTTTYFVARHAEKEAGPGSDPPLSAAGRQRAEALKYRLDKEPVAHVFATNYLRARNTAQPTADAKGLKLEVYNPRDTGFVRYIIQLKSRALLIIGHSNTVDELVNGLAGYKAIPGDLPESAYGDLFIIKKRGKRIQFRQEHFGSSEGSPQP